MITGEKKSFPGKVSVHLDIEYHVASNLLVYGEELTIPHILQHVIALLKCNPHIIHQFLNWYFSKVNPRGVINIQGFLDHLGNSDSKLVCFPPISRLDFENNSILPTKYILNPPLERKLFLQLVIQCVFSKLHGIGMLRINQGHPFGGSVPPIYLQSPTSHCLL